MYSLLFKKSAAKELSKLDKPVQIRIKEKLQILATNYDFLKSNIKQLSGKEKLFRLRVADYRIVFQKEDEELIILIVRIGHRREIYDKNF